MIALRRFNNWLNKMITGPNTGPLPRFLLFFISAFFLLQWTRRALADTAVYRFYLDGVPCSCSKTRPTACATPRLMTI